MTAIWDQVYTSEQGDVLQMGGFFVSPILENGDLYDLTADLNSSPPSLSGGIYAESTIHARVCVEIQSPIPSTSVFKGLPPRQDFGILTVGANPTYITEYRFINYPRQFIDVYDARKGITYPDTPYEVAVDGIARATANIGQLSFSDNALPKAGGAFYLFSEYPDLKIRLRGALEVYPASLYFPGRVFYTRQVL